MPDGDSLNITVEELHVHIHSNGTAEAVEEAVDVEDDDDVSGNGTSEPAERERSDGLRYDIRDRPIKGLVLEEIEDSAGVTEEALVSILDAEKWTVNRYLTHMAEQHILTVEDGYYQLTELGESVLETYRQQWRDGKRNLPGGYWEEITS